MNSNFMMMMIMKPWNWLKSLIVLIQRKNSEQYLDTMTEESKVLISVQRVFGIISLLIVRTASFSLATLGNGIGFVRDTGKDIVGVMRNEWRLIKQTHQPHCQCEFCGETTPALPEI